MTEDDPDLPVGHECQNCGERFQTDIQHASDPVCPHCGSKSRIPPDGPSDPTEPEHFSD